MSIDRLSDDDYERLARFVSGEARGEERARIARWIEADGEVKEAMASMEDSWRLAGAEAPVDVTGAWQRVSSGIGLIEKAPPPAVAKPLPAERRRRSWPGNVSMMRMAAALVVILGGLVLWPRARDRFTDDRRSEITTAATGRHYTHAGQRRTLTLPDGSEIVLGAASSIDVVDGYGNDVREVRLTGQAFFRVVHDEAHPFRVRIGQTVVEDLGTEFDVRAYTGDGSVRVAVASGSVALRTSVDSQPVAVLSPNDVAVMSGSEVAVERGVDVSRYIAWTTGRLVFTDALFSDVATELGRWYGVEVHIADPSLLTRHYTATFAGESLDEVLRLIAMSLQIRYERHRGTVTFTGPAAADSAPGSSGRAPAPPADPARVEAGA